MKLDGLNLFSPFSEIQNEWSLNPKVNGPGLNF